MKDKKQYFDNLEYVNTIVKYGGNKSIAEFQVRYHQWYVHQTVKEYIADLHLEQFATKHDLSELKYSLLLWIFSISVAGFSTTIGVTYFMIKSMLESALHTKF